MSACCRLAWPRSQFDQLGYQIRLDDWEGEALDPGTLGRRATQLVPPWSELNVFLVRYPASDCA